MPNPANQRVVHLTYTKCGSQWVRDVLTAPEIARFSGVRLDGRSPNLIHEPWPDQPRGTFLGPLYNSTPHDWHAARGADDFAIVVLRDPRDRLMSWIFSCAYSHVENPMIRTIRDPLLALDMKRRMLVGIFEYSRIARMFRLWKDHGSTDRVLVTTYEGIVADQTGAFRHMASFLGWEIPAPVLDSVIERLSFEKRSGRARGDENIHSHYRKGEAGDWRNYFDRELGRIWEAIFPGLLAALGYETDESWVETLPQTLETLAARSTTTDDPRLHQLESRIVRLTEQADELRRANTELYKALAAK